MADNGAVSNMAQDNIEGRDALWNMFHKQGDTIGKLSEGLAETRSEVKGIGGQLRDFMDSYRDGQSHVMSAIENMNKPKPNQLWQIVAVLLVILGMFGTVMMYTVSSAKEVALINSLHANEIAELKFTAVKDALASAERFGTVGFESVNQQQKEITSYLALIISKVEKAQDDIGEKSVDIAKLEQKTEDLKEYSMLIGQNTDQRIMRLADRMMDTETKASANEMGLKATGDFIKDHANKQGATGHPSPNLDIKVKEQPSGVVAP